MQNNTIVLFPADYADRDALYTALIRLLELPAWCGKNADALHDCLSEHGEAVRLALAGPVPEAIQADIGRISRVVTALGGEIEKS